MQDVYNRIEKICRENGINITQMCKAAGVPRSALSDFKAGRKQTISIINLEKIASYFNVSIDYLLGKTDEKKETALTERTLSDVLKAYADPDTETLLLFGQGLPMQEIKVKKEDLEIVRGLMDALKKKYDTEK